LHYASELLDPESNRSLAAAWKRWIVCHLVVKRRVPV
jgi:hypothetical protein